VVGVVVIFVLLGCATVALVPITSRRAKLVTQKVFPE